MLGLPPEYRLPPPVLAPLERLPLLDPYTREGLQLPCLLAAPPPPAAALLRLHLSPTTTPPMMWPPRSPPTLEAQLSSLPAEKGLPPYLLPARPPRAVLVPKKARWLVPPPLSPLRVGVVLLGPPLQRSLGLPLPPDSTPRGGQGSLLALRCSPPAQVLARAPRRALAPRATPQYPPPPGVLLLELRPHGFVMRLMAKAPLPTGGVLAGCLSTVPLKRPP